VVLSATNDLYFENYVKRNDLDLRELRKDGDRRLDAKIENAEASPGDQAGRVRDAPAVLERLAEPRHRPARG